MTTAPTNHQDHESHQDIQDLENPARGRSVTVIVAATPGDGVSKHRVKQ
jgi:hypothetical protein